MNKLIRYKDFVPQVAARGPFGGISEIEPFSAVVSAANQWIENNSIQVMNIETVILPNSSQRAYDGVYKTEIATGAEPIGWYQCVRVWYRE